MKIRTGIVFGGSSREREISFAGGRTVYDNLNKAVFEPVPLFVDNFGNFILLKWEYIYKGSIRDFFPPVNFLPDSPNEYQVYQESLSELSASQQDEMIASVGRRVSPEELPSLIDFAFLCLHGSNGEDGRVQGLLEWFRIPYSGSGILSSAIGINKGVQKKLMKNAGFDVPGFYIISREEWLHGNRTEIFNRVKETPGFPMVIKSANQGSSIGASILHEDDMGVFADAVNKSLFVYELESEDWKGLSSQDKAEFIRNLTDIRESVGIPVNLYRKSESSFEKTPVETVYHPEKLLTSIDRIFKSATAVLRIEAVDSESEVIVEDFIEGKEFSCIVIEDEQGRPVALPPTEIRKGKELFDYRSKYLPGLSRKITPIDLPSADIENICRKCEKLYSDLFFQVYARIDGFLSKDGRIILNDPNTTSGMMPSSFFFHQAAEIGLNPSQFLTYIIRTSVACRIKDIKNASRLWTLLRRLDEGIQSLQREGGERKKVAVILGGYSSERHISVESGRNIYEKLSSSEKYLPLPVFLTRTCSAPFSLYTIPVNILLKDNADDIREKIEHYHVHEMVKKIIDRCSFITSRYSSAGSIAAPHEVKVKDLHAIADVVFIALHGRPGEDGQIQRALEDEGIPYNGSGPSTSEITINKYQTNEILKSQGFLVANHSLSTRSEWKNTDKAIKDIECNFNYPFIAKPVDDGCSSAVKKIHNRQELEAYASLIFRDTEDLDAGPASVLNLKLKEEFPSKDVFLIEELISPAGAQKFLEITGGMLTHLDDNGQVDYEMFEASEALSEGDVLSLEEKFLAGQGQNITPARYAADPSNRQEISDKVKAELKRAAQVLNIEGYARIDAFVRIFPGNKVEVIFIEVNSLPGMTPATCIFHQSAINGYKPYEFIDQILEFGAKKQNRETVRQ